METKINTISDFVRELEVTLDYSEIKPEIEAAYKKERAKISIDGFRKGKAPMGMIKKLYGDAIEYRASEDIANTKFWEIVKEQNLEPISTPALADINFEPEKALTFKVQYEVKADIEVKDYSGQKIKKPVFVVKDEDIERDINTMLKSKSDFEEAEKIEDANHRITVDLHRIDENGEAIEGSAAQNMVIDLADERVNPNIAEAAIGKNINETFTFSFTDEHKHGEETHKEEFTYTANILKIEKLVMPEITEELVKSLSRNIATDMESWRKSLKETYEKYYEAQSEEISTNGLLNKIIENNEFTPPQGYVDVLFNRIAESEKEKAKREKRHFNEEMMKDNLQKQAEWMAKWQIISENIARIEKIEVTDDDLKELAEKEAENTGISVDKLIKYYKDSNRADAMLDEKIIGYLKENNEIEEFDPSKEAEGEEK